MTYNTFKFFSLTIKVLVQWYVLSYLGDGGPGAQEFETRLSITASPLLGRWLLTGVSLQDAWLAGMDYSDSWMLTSEP